MKLSMQNPSTMKAPGQPNFYFSAYPLRVIEKQEPQKKSYLHIITKSTGKKKYADGLKIHPMKNPYSAKDEQRLSAIVNKYTHIDNVEERDSEWFASYE